MSIYLEVNYEIENLRLHHLPEKLQEIIALCDEQKENSLIDCISCGVLNSVDEFGNVFPCKSCGRKRYNIYVKGLRNLE